MSTFKTPDPITVVLDLQRADVRIVASDRKDTVVEVQTHDGSNAEDATRVEFVAGRLIVSSRKILSFLPLQRRVAVDVSIALPTGSRVQGSTAMGDLKVQGRLGDCSFKCGYGDITIDCTAGQAQLTSGFGAMRIQEIEGKADLKSASGETHVGEASGDVRVSAANGDVSIGRMEGTAVLRTANGDIRVSEIVRGSVKMETANGELDIGICNGTAAWLDVKTMHGNVRSSMTNEGGPDQPSQTAEVRARTASGDIMIRRSSKSPGRKP